jgi:hypothetical protein
MSWTAPASRRSPDELPEGVGEDLDVHAVLAVLAGVEGAVGRDAVDGQQGSVQDHQRLACGNRHGLLEGGGEDGQDVHGLGDVAVGGGQADAEPGRELGEGMTAAQMGQGHQRLSAASESTPAGADPSPPSGQLPPQQSQCGSGQVQSGRIDKHAKLLAAKVDLGRQPTYQELRRSATPTPATPSHVGKGSLTWAFVVERITGIEPAL